MLASSSCSSVDVVDFVSAGGLTRSPSPDFSKPRATDEQTHEQAIELDELPVALVPKSSGKKKNKKKVSHKSAVSTEHFAELPEKPED